MWQTGKRRCEMSVRGDAYKIGERVYGAIDGQPGIVVSVDNAARTFAVQWADENALGDVVYPFDTIMVRRAYPWE